MIIKSSSQPSEVGVILLICRFGESETEQLSNLLKVTQLVKSGVCVKPGQSRQEGDVSL